jgi:hypothetical protein
MNCNVLHEQFRDVAWSGNFDARVKRALLFRGFGGGLAAHFEAMAQSA